ncbi:hypothetical protein BDV25DRAFT_126216 [Aspergillus avenaceus]|uniref:NmrA-like domain-containing protein n=1 Tax=Aspergillus avenaceus TaxID=36643 RepID=A0A5N6U8Y4_ASPAV|nr:hypothetical protein BDV25DRAFT_126216 [Aspergillus avenaceus]
MVNVAIAGGTGGVGRTILEVLQATSQHQAFVLSRQASQHLPNTITMNYDDTDRIADILERKNIHTTKRFVPSGYAIPYPQRALEFLPQLNDYFEAIYELRRSGLEWTVFHNGIFLDYFGTPALTSYLKPNVFVIDMEHKVAAIPGDGNTPVTFTYTFDLARFIVASLDLEKWDEESRVIGDEKTFNEFVALAEEARGSKFQVFYDDVEKLQRSEITELPGHKALYKQIPKESFQWFTSIFERFTADGTSHIARAGSLNERFPDIKPLSVKNMLDRYWKNA